MRYYGKIIEIIAGNLGQAIENEKGESITTYPELDTIILKTVNGNYIIKVDKR